MSSVRRLASEATWIVVGQVLATAGSLVLVRALTGYLAPAQYGELALGLTIAGLINQLVSGGINNGVARFYSIAVERSELPGYVRAASRLFGYSVLAVIAIGAFVMSALLWTGNRRWLALAGSVLVLSVFEGLNNSLSGIQNAARQRSKCATHGTLSAWLKLACAMAMVRWFGQSSVWVVTGYLVSSITVANLRLSHLRKLIPWRGDASPQDVRDWSYRIWAFSWPYSAWGMFTWAQQSSDRWALEAFVNTQDVGRYVALFQLGYVPISMVTGFAVTLLAPIVYQRAGGADDLDRRRSVHQIVWRLASTSIVLTCIGGAVALLFHRWIFALVVAPPYRSVSFLLPWIVLAGGFFATGQMFEIKLATELRSGAMLPLKIATAVIGVFLNLLFAASRGIAGVVTAQLLIAVLYATGMATLAYRTPKPTGGGNSRGP